MLVRGVIIGCMAAGLLGAPAASAQTPQKTLQATATVEARVTFTRVTEHRAKGTIRFTGRLRDGRSLRGTGRVILTGDKTPAGFRTDGRGTVIFDGTLRTTDGNRTAAPLNDAVGTLRFLGGTTEGTGIFMDKGTLKFLGGQQEGTGI